MESDYQISKLEKLLHRTIAGLFALSTVCFMVYTTELHYAHAEGDEDLGSASSSLGASVTVGTACNFSGNVDSQHNATITNGINSTDIGKTTLNVTCNDQGGYAVYAIGYTNDEYGNTSLKSSISDDYNIPTGTSTSGNTSNWSMKLSTVPGTTTATIENNYNNYHTVPDDYAKVATLNTITNPGTSTTGSSISTTYQAYISPTQPAGTYSGKVKYTLVHPSTAPKPEIPPKTISDLTYMQDFYGLSEYDKNGVINSMATDAQYTLKDSRDSKDYYISKLKDGNIWMTQNLDLDIEAGRTYTSADTDLANSTIGTSWKPIRSTRTTSSWTSSTTAPESYDPGDLYWDGTLNTDWRGNLGNETVTDPSQTSGGTHYHVGNYYNWTAAVAMNSSSGKNSGDMDQSICPAGWRLPTYSGNKSYLSLKDAQGLTAGTSGNIQNSPTYFVYGGYLDGSSPWGVGNYGYYWSSVVNDSSYAHQLFFYANGDLRPQTDGYRSFGYSLRCVAR